MRESPRSNQKRRCVAASRGRALVGAPILATLVWIVGCAVGPDYRAPETAMPDAWQLEAGRGLERGDAALETWWTVFDDAVLDDLIARAQSGNLDLQAAMARVDEARAIRGIARGEWFPSVGLDGEYQYQRRSRSFWGAFGGRNDDFYSAGLDTSWEVDVFGRIRRSNESAQASLVATEEDYHDVLVILLADVASTYVNLRTAQERLVTAQENVGIQRGTLHLTRERNRAGLSPELDVRQAQLNLARTESFIPTFHQRIAESIHRLGVLLGDRPSALRGELAPVAGIPNPPAQVMLGLPVNLLRQRPDIRSAERTIAANSAQIGVATADLYPRFALLGTFAFSALDAGRMFSGDASNFGVGPTIQWNIFNGGRVLSNIRAEEARTQLALVDYESTVLDALEETDNAIVAYVQQSTRRDALDRSVVAAREAVRLVKSLYKNGLTDFQNVLDMERSLFAQQDELAKSRGTVALDLIRIYKALGGGWQPGAGEEQPVEGAEAS